ncbi:hypothetical protein DL96DRAFT_1818716 [Flagelloscypha sp. PMI_526]|nr:hypothetical protein DL96DRAFT_1818716 [Flagelloscypha sp. PMI_526]
MSLVSHPQLPAELQGRIIQEAAYLSSWGEKNDLMLVSHLAYDRVSYVVYRIIVITTFESFAQFLSFLEAKGIDFLASRLYALHVRMGHHDTKAQSLWSTLFTSFIPKLYNLQYLEVWGNFGESAAIADIRDSLLQAIPSLSNLTYFGANTLLLNDSATTNFPLFPGVTHLKRFKNDTPVQCTLHLVKSFPKLTHFMTPIPSHISLSQLSALAEPLSHLKVIILGSYESLDSEVLSTATKRFPNLVFQNTRLLFNSADLTNFREIAQAGDKNIWKLCEEEVLQRQSFGIS